MTTPIKWRTKDIEEYNRLSRNVKNKIRYGKKKHGYDWTNQIDLPKREDIKTRAEFNSFKKEAARFTNRNVVQYNVNRQDDIIKNKHEVKVKRGELTFLEAQSAKNIRLAEKRIDELNKIPYFVQQQMRSPQERQFALGTENAVGINVPKAFNFDEIRTQARLDQKLKQSKQRALDGEMYYTKKQAQMKENYMKSLTDAFNSDADELVKTIGAMGTDDFYQLALMYPNMKDVFFASDSGNYASANAKVERSSDIPQVNQVFGYIQKFNEWKNKLNL